MFGKKDPASVYKSLNPFDDNYKMKKEYKTRELVVGNLEYVTATTELFVKTTEQKYIFEKVRKMGKTWYREVFTGFIADIENSPQHYFNIPYVVNIVDLHDELTNVADVVPKHALLLVLNEINKKKDEKEIRK